MDVRSAKSGKSRQVQGENGQRPYLRSNASDSP